MKRVGSVIICVAVLFCLPYKAAAWGFWAHRMINNKAVATLPKGMSGFYGFYIDYVTTHAVDADKKRYCDMHEASHHFIDLDHYCDCPCDSFPRHWKDAVAKYGMDTLNKYGTAPWYISLIYTKLVKAFKDQDADRILQLSSNIGHYIADSYVPLHTTINYDGQLTDQVGIHAFWESNIPELLGLTYNYDVGKARYIKDLNGFIWKGILGSASEVDSVLQIEKSVSTSFPLSKKYCFEIGQKQVEQHIAYSDAYIKAYSDKLHGMVERRMRGAVYAVGCIWMSAWVDAGQPNLDKLIGKATQ